MYFDVCESLSKANTSCSRLEAQSNLKDHALTPGRATAAEQWRFTPSMFDTNFTFGSFLNGPPGYYTPTPGGMNTVYHNHTAGDLHTPGMAFQLGTPLSMPMADGPLHPPPAFDMQTFNPSFFQTHFQNPQHSQPSHYPAHPTAYHPSILVHQDSGYANEKTPEHELDANRGIGMEGLLGSNVQAENKIAPPSSEKFVPTTSSFNFPSLADYFS